MCELNVLNCHVYTPMRKNWINRLTDYAGSYRIVLMAILSMLLYLVGGLFFKFNETYNLLWNTYMSAVSYILLFIIQHTSNRDNLLLKIKLNEIIVKLQETDSSLAELDDLDEQEIKKIVKETTNEFKPR